MQRYLLTVSYDATNYCGYQRQDNGITVQEVLEGVLQKTLGTSVKTTGASRTDAGVHALCQRVHFDAETTIPPEKLPAALNCRLPFDIRVLKGQAVPGAFHARYDTVQKHYIYRIDNAPCQNVLTRGFCTHVKYPLNEKAMHRAAQALLDEHDFAAFCAAGGNAKTTVRSIDHISVERQGDIVTISVRGKAFLYNMVRIIAGTLIEIGMGKRSESCILEAFQTLDRKVLGATAPAKGLTLAQISYGAPIDEA